MSEGRMRCCGTSLFLKTRFGAGYILNIAKANNDCVVGDVTSMVKTHVAGAELTSAVAGEIVYQLPVTSVGSFGPLFASLRDGCKSLNIGAYGVSITTLEQVFIRLAREAQRNGKVTDDDDTRTPVYFFDIVSRGIEILVSVYCWTQSRIFPNPIAVAEPAADLQPRQGVSNSSPSPNVVAPVAIAWGTPVASIDVKGGDVELGHYHSIDTHNTEQQADLESSNELKHYKFQNEHAINTTEDEKKDNDSLYYQPHQPYEAAQSTVDIQRTDGADRKDQQQLQADDNNHKISSNQLEISQGIATTHASIYVQLQELLRKRLIIASRDLKGIFFQILFPALQILLVLMILTINLSPAGRSLSLRASTISNSADVLYSGNLTAITWGKWLPIAANLKKTGASNSTALSE